MRGFSGTMKEIIQMNRTDVRIPTGGRHLNSGPTDIKSNALISQLTLPTLNLFPADATANVLIFSVLISITSCHQAGRVTFSLKLSHWTLTLLLWFPQLLMLPYQTWMWCVFCKFLLSSLTFTANLKQVFGDLRSFFPVAKEVTTANLRNSPTLTV